MINATTSGSRRLTLAVGLLSVCLTCLGCSGQRPLYAVREDGAEHERYGRLVDAEADYREYVERSRTNAQARVDLARVLTKLDRKSEAREHLELAYSLRPDDEDILDQYCEAVFDNGDYDILVRRLRDRAESRNTVQDYMRLGHWMLAMDDIDQARIAYRTAARLSGGQQIEPYLALADLAGRIRDVETEMLRLRQALYIDIEQEINDEGIRQRLRDAGMIPGPTVALPPN
jgi:Flp pilus assembly protein TadD